ncbi:GNAT family N-acetyltransferase [Amycolatopsis sp. NEAU-NG30]|uniref:GNAT family N-acetyltransferase n=1 Tax=Amycolatopsis melonis TaxID=3156488 RepID=A0ABV0LJ41_9PSEU
MTTVRPARATDVPRLTVLLAQLGYPSEPDAVAARLVSVVDGATRAVLVAVNGSRVDGFVTVERRLVLHDDALGEITGLVVDTAARRSGVGRVLVAAAEAWLARRGLRTVVVRSDVTRPESHRFYQDIGFRRTKTSHTYRKEITTAAAR